MYPPQRPVDPLAVAGLLGGRARRMSARRHCGHVMTAAGRPPLAPSRPGRSRQYRASSSRKRSSSPESLTAARDSVPAPANSPRPRRVAATLENTCARPARPQSGQAMTSLIRAHCAGVDNAIAMSANAVSVSQCKSQQIDESRHNSRKILYPCPVPERDGAGVSLNSRYRRRQLRCHAPDGSRRHDSGNAA